MNDIILNKEEFKLFNQYDQFGFFYDDMGSPKEDADETFDSDIDNLYRQYDSIIIDNNDNMFGLIKGKKELIMQSVIEAYDIAIEIKEE